ncbi:MAG: protease inhibitor I42 family protein [Pseudomonadota bacterium]
MSQKRFKLNTSILTLSILLFFIISTCKANNNPPSKHPSPPDKASFVSAKNPEYRLSLASNPSTGYHWYIVSYKPEFMRLASYQFDQPTSNKIGSGGQETWLFKLNPIAFKAPMLLKINMIYARPFELDKGEKHTFYIVTGE